MNFRKEKIAIIGSGAFGTAVANMVAENNNNVIIYGIDQEEINDINSNHKNSKYFNEHINLNIKATLDLNEALNQTKIIIFALPTKAFEIFISKSLLPLLKEPVYFVNLSKGFSFKEKIILSNLIENMIPSELNLGLLKLTGPSFAKDLIKKLPTVLNLSSKNLSLAKEMQGLFNSEFSKIVINNKIDEAEYSSNYKNSVAILSGLLNKLGYGKNSEALLLYLAIEELKLILEALNLDPSAVYEPSGIWDLFLTSSSGNSRNFTFGMSLVELQTDEKENMLSNLTVEGVESIKAFKKISEEYNLSLKIIDLLDKIIFQNFDPKETINNFFIKECKK